LKIGKTPENLTSDPVRWPSKNFEVKFLPYFFLLQIRRQKVVELAGGKKMPDFDNSIEWNIG
jgi:hypothetical protein